MATLSSEATSFTADDGTVRVGEELRFATLEELRAESRQMGERNREALTQAEAEQQEHYWHEKMAGDDRKWRVWVKTSFAELRHQQKLRELAAHHGEVHEDDNGRIYVGKDARRQFRRKWEAGRFQGSAPRHRPRS
jgi:hypothetical protein